MSPRPASQKPETRQVPPTPAPAGSGSRWCDWCKREPGYRVAASRWACSDTCNRLLIGTAVGAGRLKIPLREYRRHIKAGEKWCWGCGRWQKVDEFGVRRTNPDGLDNLCRRASVKNVTAYQQRKRRAS